MSLTKEPEAWLDGEGQEHLLQGNCSIGRAVLNTLVLESAKVSRLHALVHSERGGAFWLVDLGSSNGTFFNGRRIYEPTRLRDRDQITIAGNTFTFRQSRDPFDKPKSTAPPLTLQEGIEDVPCWLLITDIKNFTSLSRTLASDKLARLISFWLATCKEIIETHRGIVNKYLGDGILAYWPCEKCAGQDIVTVIAALKEAQIRDPEFRFVVHFGLVAIGGVSSVKEETLMGSDVNLAFRLQQLAATLGIRCAISSEARARLGESVAADYVGDYELKGFEGKRSLFAA